MPKSIPILQSTMHLPPLLGNGDSYLFLHAHVALTILEPAEVINDVTVEPYSFYQSCHADILDHVIVVACYHFVCDILY